MSKGRRLLSVYRRFLCRLRANYRLHSRVCFCELRHGRSEAGCLRPDVVC